MRRISKHEAFRLSGRFPFYVSSPLVLAQPEKHRLPQFSVAGPLGELDFGDEFGIYPVHFFHHRRRNALDPFAALSASRTDSSRGEFGWKIDKRTVVPLFSAEFFVQDR